MAEEIVRLHEAVTGRRELNVEKLKWVENLGMNDFLEWLKTIDGENIVTEEEIQWYEYLKANGQLEGEDTENKLAEYFKVEDDCVDHEAVLEQIKNENAEKEKLLAHLKKIEETLSIQLKNQDQDLNYSNDKETLKNNSKCYDENCERLFHESNNCQHAFSNLQNEIPSSEKDEKFISNQEKNSKLFFENLQILHKIVEDIRSNFFSQEDSDEFPPNYVNNHLDKCMKTLSLLENDLEEVKIEITWLDEAIRFVQDLNVDNVDLEEKKIALKQEETPDLSAEIKKLGEKRARNQNHQLQIEVLGDNKFLERLQGRLSMMRDFYDICRPLRVLSEVYTRLIEAEGVKAKASFASLISAFDSIASLAQKYEEFKEIFKKLYSAKLDTKKNLEIVTDFLDLNQCMIHEEKLFFENVELFFSKVNEGLQKVKEENNLLLNSSTKMANISLPELYFEVDGRLKEAIISLDNLIKKYENFKKRSKP